MFNVINVENRPFRVIAPTNKMCSMFIVSFNQSQCALLFPDAANISTASNQLNYELAIPNEKLLETLTQIGITLHWPKMRRRNRGNIKRTFLSSTRLLNPAMFCTKHLHKNDVLHSCNILCLLQVSFNHVCLRLLISFPSCTLLNSH